MKDYISCLNKKNQGKNKIEKLIKFYINIGELNIALATENMGKIIKKKNDFYLLDTEFWDNMLDSINNLDIDNIFPFFVPDFSTFLYSMRTQTMIANILINELMKINNYESKFYGHFKEFIKDIEGIKNINNFNLDELGTDTDFNIIHTLFGKDENSKSFYIEYDKEVANLIEQNPQEGKIYRDKLEKMDSKEDILYGKLLAILSNLNASIELINHPEKFKSEKKLEKSVAKTKKSKDFSLTHN